MFTRLKLVSSLLAFSCSGTALAQQFAPDLDCNARWLRRDNQAACEIRELTIPATGSLSIDAGSSGAVHVRGWNEDEVHVRAQVVAWGRGSEAAQAALDEVVIRTDGVLRTERPARGRGWAVSYDIRAPRGTSLTVDAANGAITIADIAGELDLETTNGRIAATGVNGTVRGRSTNGAIDIRLSDEPFTGDSLDLQATNGAVRLQVPQDFSAELDARSINGGIRVTVPVDTDGPRARNWIDGTLGNGGPLLRIRTTNGAVRIEN